MAEAVSFQLDERVRDAAIQVLHEHGWDGLTLERVAEASGRARLARGLEALCEVVDRHLPLLLATDEAFHQEAPGGPDSYLDPFVHFLREGAQDGSLPLGDDDPTEAADLAFNAV